MKHTLAAVAVLCLPFEAHGQPCTADVTSVVRHGARPNDGREDTAAVQQLLDSMPSGGVVYFPPGVYILRELRAPANVTLLGRHPCARPTSRRATLQLGAGPAVKRGPTTLECRDGSPTLDVAGPNVRVSGFVFDGRLDSHPKEGGQTSAFQNPKGGFSGGCSGELRFDRCGEVFGLGAAFRAGIRASPCPSGPPLDGLSVTDNSFFDNFGSAIAVRNVNDVEILRNEHDNSWQSFAFVDAVGLPGGIPIYEGVTISDNVMTNMIGPTFGRQIANAMVVGIYRDVLVNNNRAEGMERTMLRLVAHDARVVGNVASLNNVNLDPYAETGTFGIIDIHQSAERITIADNHFFDIGRGITTNTSFGCRDIRIENNLIERVLGTDPQDETTPNGIGIINQCQGPGIVIEHNHLLDIGGHAISILNPVSDVRIVGNVLRGRENGRVGSAIRLHPSHGVVRDVLIASNHMSGFNEDLLDRLMSIRHPATYEGLFIIDNQLDARAPGGRAIWATSGAQHPNYLRSGVVAHNTINGATSGEHDAHCLDVQNNYTTGSNDLVGGFDASCEPDADADGLYDIFDLEPLLASTQFSDRAPFGRIDGEVLSNGGLNVTVSPTPSPTSDILLTTDASGPGPASVEITCSAGPAGRPVTYVLELLPADSMIVECGP